VSEEGVNSRFERGATGWYVIDRKVDNLRSGGVIFVERSEVGDGFC